MKLTRFIPLIALIVLSRPFAGLTQTEAEAPVVMAVQPSGDFLFDDFFIARTLRVDYTMAGDRNGETVFLEKIRQEPF